MTDDEAEFLIEEVLKGERASMPVGGLSLDEVVEKARQVMDALTVVSVAKSVDWLRSMGATDEEAQEHEKWATARALADRAKNLATVRTMLSGMTRLGRH